MVVQKILLDFGSTKREDLKKKVSQKLGFRRLGTKIEKRIDEVFEQLLYQKLMDQDNSGILSWRNQSKLK